ncbi:hypothetical protein ACFO5R_04070 [Halosolutus amylolyticus]|uniref:DUF7382 domain-containing protein n=1 Tax=Halosolutus amylolyticus TaxID=2932267 RepID=A0ABD5PKQ1_9EURY|nr:hypothetical protein [Halosolutus amylolyticus]
MVPNTLLSDDSDRPARSRSFTEDDRAIEGLPIRLVIALVVGVAALALMLNMLGTIGTVGDTEVTAEIDDTDQVIEAGQKQDVTIDVIDENGNEVEDATIIVTAGSAQLNGPADEYTGSSSNSADVTIDPDLRADQDKGTLEIDVVPPSDSNYIDEQPNAEIVVVDR